VSHEILKYPRTSHLVGSALQRGDEPDRVSMAALRSRGVCRFEEKIDGANCGVSFAADGGPTAAMVLQCRGHALTGGAGERQFNLFKAWAQTHERALRDILGRRYIMYAEWMFALHSVYYDCLPHYLNEYDIYDRERQVFLATPIRHAMLAGSPIVSVPVVHEGWVADKALPSLVKPSLYKTRDWRRSLEIAARAARVDVAALAVDMEDLAEGLYLKQEDDAAGVVIGRYKYVRPSFVQRILDGGVHWKARPIVENQLAPGVDIFAHHPEAEAAAPGS
jgi:hypothetical protein